MSETQAAGASAPHIVVESRGAVALVSLNRPERLNAWTRGMGTLWFDILERLARDPGVRAIVLTGAGRGFCSGADGSLLSDLSAEGGVMAVPETRPYYFPVTIGKPIIAAIRGACIGIGLQQALCCDLRFVAADAKISTAYARLGLVAECGISWLLSRIVGASNAADLLLSARMIDGAEALRMGLANRVCTAETVLDEALAYAQALATDCSPRSMRTMKLQLSRDLEATLPEAYERSSAVLDEALASPDFGEGVKAWKERRAPAYPPLDAALARIDPAPGAK